MNSHLLGTYTLLCRAREMAGQANADLYLDHLVHELDTLCEAVKTDIAEEAKRLNIRQKPVRIDIAA